jgi:trimeric autotransporter adhesin
MRTLKLNRYLPGVSMAVLSLLLATTPQKVRAQAFAGTPTVTFGSATIDRSVPNVDTITLPNSSPVTTINWVPTDTAIGGGPINFLPNGKVVNYVGSPGESTPYTVLNRVLPTDATRAIRFDGTVNASNSVRVWFYSPGGLLIGSTARFNVGGLLLSTSDLVTTGGNFMPVQDQFSVAGTAGSTAAVVIESGAEIRAEAMGQSNYVVAVAPRIQQDGLISVRGSTALVAAESADFAVDSQGLFNITVTQGSEVASNTFSHTGTTGGPDASSGVNARRVYMVAVPKNNAITMAIQSGGSIGFDIAGAADTVGNTIVLSAGHNIADTGNGDPIVANQAGVGSADLTVSRGSYTSNTVIRSMTDATVADNIVGGTPDINFASDLSVRAASTAAVRADQGAVSIGGSVSVSADAPTNGFAGIAVLAVGGAGTTLTTNGALVSANNTDRNAPITFAGTARVTSAGGLVSVIGDIAVSAIAQGTNASGGGMGGAASGGNAIVRATNGGGVSATGAIILDATGTGGAGGDNTGNVGGDGLGGITLIEATGVGSAVAVGTGLGLSAGGVGGNAGNSNGRGGNGTGGFADLLASSGNISVTNAAGGGIDIQLSGKGGSAGAGGNATGGNANIFADGAIISTFGDRGLRIDATATGGQANAALGDGGNAIGGVINVRTTGMNARIETNIGGGSAGAGLFGIELSAGGFAGNATAPGTNGGNGIGGSINIATTGAGQQIINNSAMGTLLDAQAMGGNAGGGIGAAGDATGGLSSIDIAGGSFTATQGFVELRSRAQGGLGNVNLTGKARGGNASIKVTGAMNVVGNISLSAGAQSLFGGVAKDAFGGRTSLLVDGGLVTVSGFTSFDVLTFGGSGGGFGVGDAIGGTVELTAINNASVSLNGDVGFNSRTVGGDTGTGFGGDAIGGEVTVRAMGSDIALGAVSGNVTFENEATPGLGDFPGQSIVRNALFETNPTGRIALGSTVTGGAGNITIGGTIDPFVNGVYLTFSAANDVAMNTSIANTVAGSSIVLRADNQGAGTGTVTFGATNTVDLSGAGATIDIYHNPTVFGTATDYSSNIISGAFTNYQLVHNAGQLQSIDNYLNQSFALARDVDLISLAGANSGTGFQPIGTDALGNLTNGTGFTGNFDGQGFTIRNLFINRTTNFVGLFGGVTGSIIRNVILSGGSVTSAGYRIGSLVGHLGNATIANSHSSVGVFASAGGDLGGLVGHVNGGSIVRDSSASGTVSNIGGQFSTGGLVGYNGGTIQRSWATGNVTLDGTVRGVGGLVGFNDGNIDQSYATGNVTGGSSIVGVGGLVGYIQNGVVSRSYAVGDVSGTTSVGGFVGYIEAAGSASQSYASGAVVGSTDVGGFVGTNEGSITDSYWDNFSTGQSVGFGSDVGSITNLNAVTSDPGQSAAANYAFNPASYSNFSPSGWTSFGGDSRPIGEWEIARAEYGQTTIRSLHQLQFIHNDLAGNYRLAFDIDAFELQRVGAVLGGKGFSPIGSGAAPFSGQFDGAGHVVSSLYINRPTGNVGLFDTNSGTIRNLGLSNVAITGGNNRVGSLVGTNNGLITGAFATGTINSTGSVTGGLVGENNNTGMLTQSYASVNVTGANTVGGLVGINAGALSFSYANGPVSGPNAGGLVGTNAVLATVGDSYWDTQTSGRANACGTDNGTNCSVAIGLTTAQSRQSSSYAGWSIDTVGGQNNIWRLYEGQTGPLLHSFLRPLLVGPASETRVYDGTVPALNVLRPGADLAHIFGTAFLNGASRNVGSHNVTYGGGLYSGQRGYDIIADMTPATLVITPAALTLTAVNDSRSYNATKASAGSVQIAGLIGGDNIVGLSQSFDSANAGARTLGVTAGYVINDGNGGNNYAIITNTAAGSISQAALTLSAVTDTRAYNATNGSAVAVSIVGLQGPDSVSGLSQSFDSINAGARTLSVNGGYSVNDGNGGNNYTISSNTAAGTINQAALTLSAVSDSRTYDKTITSSGTVSVTGIQGSDSVTGLSQSFDSVNAGARTLNVNGGYAVNDGNGGNNYAVTSNTSAGTINQAVLTLSAVTDTRTYNATSASAGTATASGLIGGDSITGLTQSFDSANAGARTLGVTAGYVINDGNGGNNYAVTSNTAAGTINQAALTLSAVTDTRNYNASTNSGGSVSISGLLGSDNIAGLTQSFDSANAGTRTLGVTAGYVINDGNGGGNYSITSNTAAGTINQAALTLSAVTDTRAYNATKASAVAVSIVGLQGGDNITGLAQSFDSINAGARTLGVNGGYSVNDGNGGNNYTITTNTASGAINQASLTLSAVTDTRAYNATKASAAAVSIIGLQGPDSVSGLSQSFDSVNAGARTLSVNGGYSVNDGNGGNNYAITANTAAGTINQAALTLSAVTDNRTYNKTITSSGTVSVTGIQGSDSVSGLSQSFDSANAGARTLNVNGGYTVNDGNGGNNYAITSNAAAGTINQAALTLSAVTDSRTYNATSASAGTAAASGLIGGDSITGLTQSFDSANAGARTLGVNGGYTVNDGNGGNNYAITASTSAGTIIQAALTLSAATDTRTYNATTGSAGTVSVAGLQGADNVTGLTQSFDSANAGARTLGVNGGYAVNDGNGGNNYAITSNTAAGSINPALATVTYTASLAASSYGNTPAGLTGIASAAGLFGADSLASVTSGAAVFATSATNTSNVGAYAITGSGLGGSTGNYSLSFVQAAGNATALSINPRAVTVTADALNRLYGDANPTLTYNSIGLVNGDVLGGSLTTLANTVSNVGTYAINQGSLANSNYAISYSGALLSVTPRPLTITGDSFSRIYGDVNPALTFTSNGLVNGDTLTGSLATVANNLSNVGRYAINQGSVVASANYSISYNAGSLAITPRALTITANAQTRLYGDTNPAFTFGSNGLVNGDTISGSLTSSATVLSNVGSYGIAQGGLSASANYSLIFNPANLTITARPVTVNATALSRAYGDANPALTYTSAGLVNGDGLTGSLSTVADVRSNTGLYQIDQGNLAASANYILTFNPANLTITQRALNISATPQSRLVGEANPALTYASTGLVNGDALSGSLGTNANATSLAGDYSITQGSLAASSNYATVFGGAVLTVLNCSASAGCTNVMDVVKQVAVGVQSVAPTQSAEDAQEEQKEQAAAESSADPEVMISDVVDTSGVTMPAPIDEPVSGGGNSSLWLPGAPQ